MIEKIRLDLVWEVQWVFKLMIDLVDQIDLPSIIILRLQVNLWSMTDQEVQIDLQFKKVPMHPASSW